MMFRENPEYCSRELRSSYDISGYLLIPPIPSVSEELLSGTGRSISFHDRNDEWSIYDRMYTLAPSPPPWQLSEYHGAHPEEVVPR